MTDPDGPGGDEDGGFVTLSSRIAYRNRWMQVREDRILRPNGEEGLYGVVERGDFAVVVPLGEGPDGPEITLVQQFRYPLRRRLWELPMGAWEDRPDAPPEEVARGELVEETGLEADGMRHAGMLYQGPGFSDLRGHIFLATGLRQGRHRRESTEADMICAAFPLSRVEAMIRDGEITCMVTVAAFGLLRARGWL